MMPLRLPTYARLPATVTCEPDADTPGNPNAHFSFSRGTAVGDSPAAAAGWKRVLKMLPLKPFHAGARGSSGVGVAQNADFGMTSSGVRYEPAGRPVTYSATARRSAGVSDAPSRRMMNELNAVSTYSGVNPLSASRPGMRGIVPS